MTGHDWKTGAKRIEEMEEGKEYLAKKPHPRILDPYREQIMKWLEENLSGVRIHKKLREEGEKVFVRMHALPGEEGQVNFGYLKYTLLYYEGKKRKTWIFNMYQCRSRIYSTP